MADFGNYTPTFTPPQYTTGTAPSGGTGAALAPTNQTSTKTAYKLDGTAVQVPATTPTQTWSPNMGYSDGILFSSPPPAQTGTGGSSGITSPSYATTPSGTSVSGNTTLSAPAYETQQLVQLQAQIQAAAAKTQNTALTEQQRADAQAEMQRLQAQIAGESALTAQKAQLSDSSFASRLAMLSSGSGGGAGAAPTPTYDPAAASAARSAAFAHAKEMAGQNALASLQSLKGLMEATGRMGSSMEAQGMAGVVNGAQNGVGDFIRRQMISDVDHADTQDATAHADWQRALDREASQKQSLLSLVNSTLY